jgi:hypothetical protein
MTPLPALVALLLSAVPTPEVVSVSVEPAALSLSHPRFGHRLLVTGRTADGWEIDLSAAAEWKAADPAVAAIENGVVVPRGNGRTTVSAVVAGRTVSVPVTVEKFAAEPPVSMRLEMMPVLTKAGCNAGACHGAQYGKGGLKLSLFGSEPDADHKALLREGAGRRVDLLVPEASLLLAKPVGRVPHQGGVLIYDGSRAYSILHRWVRTGAPAERADAAPTLTSLEIFPRARMYRTDDRAAATQRLLVIAGFSDGSRRDVTADVRFDSNRPGTAAVAPDGTAAIAGRGEAAVMARYMGLAAVATLTVVRDDAGFAWSAPPEHNFIDGLVDAKLRRMRFTPSPVCSDEEFVRRASLDATGALPDPDEVAAFLADPAPSRDKRAKYVDRLLARPEFVDFWTQRWGDWLRNRADSERSQKPMLALHNWLRAAVRDNKPLDRMAAELITARGSTFRSGPANFFRLNRGPENAAEAAAQLFLGIRLQCARCHQHPFERWTQEDYHSLAAYFARIGTKNDPEYGLFGGGVDIVLKPTGETRHPRTGKTLAPRPPGATEPADDPADRRLALARWLTDPANPGMARNFANRYWAHFLGRGLVEPVDDVRDTNPPTNPELLEALAADLVRSGWDARHLIRTIMLSRTYQTSSRPTAGNAGDTQFHSRYYVKRLTAEQLLDAVCTVTGVAEKFPLLPAGTRATGLPDPGTDSYFLDVFGRPKRETACECERQGDPNMAQVLHLINGQAINAKLASPDAWPARLARAGKTDAEIIERLYLLALSRRPSDRERTTAEALVKSAPSRKEGLEDLLWTLCNSKEFLFVH